MNDEEPKYPEYEDYIISTGWLMVAWVVFILCMVGFIIVEVAF